MIRDRRWRALDLAVLVGLSLVGLFGLALLVYILAIA
jgi:hypothetical protein